MICKNCGHHERYHDEVVGCLGGPGNCECEAMIHANDKCDTCDGDGWVPDRSGNFPDHPGVNAGPFIEKMECPACQGTGNATPDGCQGSGVRPELFDPEF